MTQSQEKPRRRPHAASGRGSRNPPKSRGGTGKDKTARFAQDLPAGLTSRMLTVAAVHGVMRRGETFETVFERHHAAAGSPPLEPRDRAFARLLATTVLRRSGELATVLDAFMERRPLPETGALWSILLCGAAQLTMIDTPAHAAISLSVDLARQDRKTRRFDKLVNAVLRRVAERGKTILAEAGSAMGNIPAWMLARWEAAYGSSLAREIAMASLQPPLLDLTAKTDPAACAEQLHGQLLPTGTVRLDQRGRIDALPGFEAGEWWVQDAAAALPALMLGDVRGKTVVDLCSAPGGKTAQLAVRGGLVTSVDISEQRLGHVRQNLDRLGLTAELVVADVLAWQPERRFDAVLLDAPCTATGTIRRHPDILHLRRESDIVQLAALQERLLQAAMRLVAPGGVLVFSTCSLEPEEGQRHRAAFLAAAERWQPLPLTAGEHGIPAMCLSPDGDLRALPHHVISESALGTGLDGFYATRWRRSDAGR